MDAHRRLEILLTDEQAQGRLLVETYKAYFTAGVERCYSFMAADEPGSNGGLANFRHTSKQVEQLAGKARLVRDEELCG